jgi:hypothetical protein
LLQTKKKGTRERDFIWKGLFSAADASVISMPAHRVKVHVESMSYSLDMRYESMRAPASSNAMSPLLSAGIGSLPHQIKLFPVVGERSCLQSSGYRVYSSSHAHTRQLFKLKWVHHNMCLANPRQIFHCLFQETRLKGHVSPCAPPSGRSPPPGNVEARRLGSFSLN